MTGARKRPAIIVVGLILGLLAVTLQGVQGEELEVPSEDQCRPYIEKALKDLGTDGSQEHVEAADTENDEGPAEESAADVNENDEESGSREKRDVSGEEEAVEGDEETDEKSTENENEAEQEQSGEETAEVDGDAEQEEGSDDEGGEPTDFKEEEEDKSKEGEVSSEKVGEDEAAAAGESGESGEAKVSEENEVVVEEEGGSTEEQKEEEEEGSEAENSGEEAAAEEGESGEEQKSAEEEGENEAKSGETEEVKGEEEEDAGSEGSGDSKEEETASEAGESKEEEEGEEASTAGEESKEEVGGSEQEVESKEEKGDESEEQKESDEKEDKSGEEEKKESVEEAVVSAEDAKVDEAGKSGEESKEDGAESKEGEDAGESKEAKSEEDKESKEEASGDAESKEDGDEASGDTESTEADEESSPEEEELIMEIEIPEILRPRDHINQLLKLDEENEEKEKAVEKVADVVLRDLKRLYDNAIKPLETLYKYRDLSNRHFGDPEIFSKPLVLFMGPWSGGKSSIINYLLDIEYKPTSLRTGAEPSPAYFNIVMHGEEEEILDGTQLAADWTFSGLQKFGQGLLDRLKGFKLNNKLLEKVNIVEIPGILEIRKQVQRLFPFNDACQWFIDRADIIFLVYDPSKLDVGPETEAILDQLKGREYQTRMILNKADQVKPEELMRVQGALIWNISPLMSSAEPPIMYSTSLWSIPYEAGAPTRLLYAQERAFLRDLRTAIDKRVEHKIASARRFAVRVRNHAKMVDCYLTTYYNHKSFFAKKKDISDRIIENPQDYHIYEGLSTLTNISRYDLPDPDVYRDFFRLNTLYEFPLLSSTCTYFRGCPINRLDVAIAYDLPELIGKYKKSVDAVLHQETSNVPQGAAAAAVEADKSGSNEKLSGQVKARSGASRITLS